MRQDKKIYAYILPHFSWLSAVAIALSSITTTVAAAELKVLSVGDGDTIRVSSPSGANKTTVRLACIDAPETSQVLGIDARQALQAELPIGTEVGLRPKATDRYGRYLSAKLSACDAVRGNKLNINCFLLMAL